MRRSAVRDAFAACEAIATDRVLATKAGDFADGYRAAASDIAGAIRAKQYGRSPTSLERELRDAETEARTLARIVAAASEVVADMCDDAAGADAVRELLAQFFDPFDLPQELRPRAAHASTPQLRRVRKGAA